MGNRKSETVIWCTCPYILSALICKHLSKSQETYIIYTSDECLVRFTAADNHNITLKSISDIHGSWLQKVLHNIFTIILSNSKMSHLWSRDRKKLLAARTIPGFFSRLNIGLRPKALRKYYNALMRIVPGPKFKNSEIYVYTLSRDYYFFVDHTCNVKLVFDSWDHPFKYPILFSPTETYCWNAAIKSTLQDLHGLGNIIVADTGRFRRVRASTHSILPKKWVYAMSYSHRDSERYFNYEIDQIQKIAEFCHRHGKKLYVKLKPISDDHDLSALKVIDNVAVDLTQNNMLASDEFYAQQEEYLKNIELCFGFATTFILDAACAGTPVFLLNFIDSNDRILHDLTSNDQTIKYVMPVANEVFGDSYSSQRPLDLLQHIDVATLMSIAFEFSRRMYIWLTPEIDHSSFPLIQKERFRSS